MLLKKWIANHWTKINRSDDSDDCISDCSKEFTKISEKIVDNLQISSLGGCTKQCAIYFYPIDGTYVACASCMIDLKYVRIELISAIRKHVIDYRDAIDDIVQIAEIRYFSMQYLLDLYTVKVHSSGLF